MSKNHVYTGKDNNSNNPVYAFSACAGIALANSHFPFFDAYRIAEACCANAKKRAKKEDMKIVYFDDENKEHKLIGNWLDFQICDHINIMQLEKYRKRQYVLSDGTNLLKRPYWVPGALADKFESDNEKLSELSIETLIKAIQDLTEQSSGNANQIEAGFEQAVPRRWLKKARAAYTRGKAAFNAFIVEAESRHRNFPIDEKNSYLNDRANYYDAIDLIDHFQDITLDKSQEELEE